MAIQTPAILLSVSAAVATDPGAVLPAAKWVQIAVEGEYLGHAVGPFKLTREKFNEAVANFHAHPAYKMGATTAAADTINAGTYDVIPWDFHHASEQSATSGTIPTTGAPAQGWNLDLEVRNGPDGKAQLWSFTRFLEPLKTFVAEQKYKWCSMTMYLDAVDPVSAKKVGAYISSVAATNDPFLQGMVPLAASRGGKQAPAQLGYYFDPYDMPATMEEAVETIRRMLKMPETSGAEQIMVELQKLRSWAVGEVETPAGIDVDDIVGALRRIINLPITATVQSVFESTFALFATVEAEPPSVPPATVAASLLEVGFDAAAFIETHATDLAKWSALGPDDAKKALLTSGASDLVANEVVAFLGRATKNKGASKSPTSGKVEAGKVPPMDQAKLNALIAAKLGVPTSTADVEKDLLVKLEASADAMAKLESLYTALEVENPAEAAARIADMFRKCAELEKAMPELAQLREMKAAADVAAAEDDVSKAMATHKMPESARKALLHLRKADAAAFAKEYPVAPADKTYLLNRQFAGTEQGGFGAGGAGFQLSGAGGAGGATVPPPGQGKGVDLSAYPGVNNTQRAHAHLVATMGKAFTDLHMDQKFAMGRKLLADLGLVQGNTRGNAQGY